MKSKLKSKVCSMNKYASLQGYSHMIIHGLVCITVLGSQFSKKKNTKKQQNKNLSNSKNPNLQKKSTT